MSAKKLTPAEEGEMAVRNDERIQTFDLNFLDGNKTKTPSGGHYLVHYFWTDERGRERHEAGQYGDNELSEIAECLGPIEAAKLRALKPGQSATWTGHYHGKQKQVLVNRVW